MAIFLSIPDAARQLKISRNFLYKLVRAGKVPHYRLSSRSIRIDLEELKAVARFQPLQKTETEQGL